MTKKAQRNLFRSTSFSIETNAETGQKENRYISEETIPSVYSMTDAKSGELKQVIYHKSTQIVAGKVIPINEDIKMKDGYLEVPPHETVLLKFLENHPNLKTPENEKRGNKILFEKVDIVGERQKDISSADALVNAFNLISSSDPRSLVIYGKTIGVDTIDVEDLLKSSLKPKERDSILLSDGYKSFIVDMKNAAKMDPDTFASGLGNPLNVAVMTIVEGIENNVLTYDEPGSTYAWKHGNDILPIKQVPEGYTNHREWFAQWLVETPATFDELTRRVEIAKNVQVT